MEVMQGAKVRRIMVPDQTGRKTFTRPQVLEFKFSIEKVGYGGTCLSSQVLWEA
jgi:hypothetical protein